MKNKRKFWIGVGMVGFIVVTLIEVWLGNYGYLINMIPFLWLYRLWRTLN